MKMFYLTLIFRFLITFILIEFTRGSTCNAALGLSYDTPAGKRIPDNQLSASTEDHYCLAIYGRLGYKITRNEFGAWCPEDDDPRPWYQVDFGETLTVRKITLGTNIDLYQYVTSYSVSYSYESTRWYAVIDGTGKNKVLKGIEDIYEAATADIGTYITARYFRLYPLTKYQNYCMNLEMFGCFPGKGCDEPIGIAKANVILDDQFSSSSVRLDHHAYDARLHNKFRRSPRQWGAWCAHEQDLSPWLQIDLKTVREISGVSTQGSPFVSLEAWTTQYKVKHSIDGVHWFIYTNGTLLKGNSDSNTVMTNHFNDTFFARYVKLIPVNWHRPSEPCLRVELYECLPRSESIPTLLTGLTDITINRGEELLLECVYLGQPEIQLEWRRNGNFLTTDYRVNSILSENLSNVTALLQFERITAKDNASFSCLAWYPGLPATHAKSTSIVTVLSPIPLLNIANVSSNFVVVELSFVGTLSKDVRSFVIKVNHSKMPSDNKVIPVDAKMLNKTKSIIYTLTTLRPYSKYTFQVAFMYVADELGEFTSLRRVFTKQDVPYGAPLDLRVQRTSPRTLSCSWELPDVTLRNGRIVAYEVRYIKSVEEGETEGSLYKIVNGTNLSLPNLEAGVIYQISVRAYTSVGSGPFTFPSNLVFTGKATAELNKINHMKITKNNAAAVSTRLNNITSDRKNLNKHDVELSIDILEKVVEVENSTDIGESLVNTVSNVLKANTSVLDESEMTNRTGTRYVKVLEKWLEGVDPKDKVLEEDSHNIVVKKVFLNKDKIVEEIKFAEEEAEITVPTRAIPKNKTEDISIYFVYYKKNKFFRKPRVLETKCVNGFTVTKERVYTPVIAGDIVGSDTQNLSAPVILKFNTNTNKTIEESACVSWDFKANNEKGDWSTKGCSVHRIVGQTIECHCNHMTNYAAMMDIYAYSSKICGQHQEIISYITIIGSFLSLIGLFVTFLTYTMFRRLTHELSAKVLVHLCISLFVVVLTFIVGIEQVARPMICTSVAIVLHYFTLVSFLWMMIEAILMYYSFVKVWPPREGGDVIKSSIVAWGLPLIIVIATYLTNRNSYSGQHYCHVTGTPLYATYLAPMALVILTNFVLFILIMYGLSTRPDNNTNMTHITRALIRCRRAFGIMILMGLTWSFGFGLATSARLSFSYLFAVSNGLQGFAIFIFYCLAQKNARNEWKRFFTCDRRAKHERNTDSYSERLRLSSELSTRTQQIRGSDASTLIRGTSKSGFAKTGFVPGFDSSIELLSSETPIQVNPFKFRALTPPQSPGSQKNVNIFEMESLLNTDDGINTGLQEEEVPNTPAEDEILDMKLQEEEDEEATEKLKPKIDLKKYSSYRALSGPTSFDVFSLVKTPSAKSLHKDSQHRKSAEFINRKTLSKNRLNRSSMIESSSLASSQYRLRMRSAKSMEQVNKRKNSVNMFDANANDMLLLDLEKHRNNNSKVEEVTDDSTVVSGVEEKTVPSDSDTLGPTQQTYTVNVGTMKSDATTMTDPLELNANGLLQNPMYGFKADTHRSPDDIIQWLHEGDELEKCDGTDSDYSSTFYKTSRSSSMTELHGPFPSSASDTSKPKKTREKELLDNMILSPLKGTQSRHSTVSNSNRPTKRLKPKRYSNRKSSSKSDSEEEESELSEDGYSASEEDIVENGGQLVNRTRSRRRKTRRRSTNLSKLSQFVTLEEPTSHVSFV